MFKKKTFWGLIAGLLLVLCCPVMASAASSAPPVKTYKGGTWKTSGNKKYYKVKKKKVTGWAKIGKKIYFFKKNGVMYTGWKDYKGKSYFFDTKKKSGAMVRGCFYTGEDGNLYYFKSDGASEKGTFSLKSGGTKKYYYARKKNHALVRSMWSSVAGGKWYYFGGKGVRHTKWFTISGKKYYCSPTKGKLAGWNKIDGTYYYFGDSGCVEVSRWLQGKTAGELWFVNEAGAVERTICEGDGTYADYGDIIMVGDSRFYHTYYNYGITADNVTYIAKSKMGYEWLESTAYYSIENKVREDYARRQAQLQSSEQGSPEPVFGRTAIVLNLGVNDLENLKKYRIFANGALKQLAQQYDCDLYYVSVNPINTKKFLNNSRRRTEWILSFNSKLQMYLDPVWTYVDTYGYLTSRYGKDYSVITLEDGLHYDAVISRVIFNRIMSEIAPKK